MSQGTLAASIVIDSTLTKSRFPSFNTKTRGPGFPVDPKPNNHHGGNHGGRGSSPAAGDSGLPSAVEKSSPVEVNLFGPVSISVVDLRGWSHLGPF